MDHDIASLRGDAHARDALEWLCQACRAECLEAKPIEAYRISILSGIIDIAVGWRVFGVADACLVVGCHWGHLACAGVHDIEMMVEHVRNPALRETFPYASESLCAGGEDDVVCPLCP